MPNTLAHISVQSLFSKVLFRQADMKWIGLGCIVPDLPWIVQRIVPVVMPHIDLINLSVFCIIQASLMFSIIFCGALSLLLRDGHKIFMLLSVNCLMHLILDGLQFKWSTGVHLLAPFSWELQSFGLFWPESWIMYVLTISGVFLFVFFVYRDPDQSIQISRDTIRRTGSLFLLSLYMFLPIFLFSGPYAADNNYAATLSDPTTRTGKKLMTDRSRFLAHEKQIQVYSGEKIKVIGALPEKDAIVSVHGVFLAPDTLRITDLHVHYRLRDLSSVFGLAAILFLWLKAVVQKNINLQNPKE